MVSTTLIAARFQPRTSLRARMPSGQRQPNEPPVTDDSERRFTIESAESLIVRQSANRLLRERYGWRGYHTVSLPANQTSSRTTLTALENGVAIGTITVGLDDTAGMNSDDAFGDELDALRQAGQRLCEFTKLAIDPITGNKRVLAALFHVAHIVAYLLRGRDRLVMEVNPRHVRYYQRMLGAQVIGSERINRAVNAPAVLLSLGFDYIASCIHEFGGHPECAGTERSLYPLAFTPDEERGIVARLMAVQQPASPALN